MVIIPPTLQIETTPIIGPKMPELDELGSQLEELCPLSGWFRSPAESISKVIAKRINLSLMPLESRHCISGELVTGKL